MTQTQRKPSKIELAPNQIYIKRPDCVNPVQTLVESASPGWSFHRWEYTGVISLYYKGRPITSFVQCSESGGFREESNRDPDAPVFSSLADAAQHCMHTKYLDYIDSVNQQEGLEDWSIRTSFTPMSLNLRLRLPPQEYSRLKHIAAISGRDIDQIVLQALYTLLPELEDRYSLDETDSDKEQTKVEEAVR